MEESGLREGETALAPGTIEAAPSERVVFIGRIRSPWRNRDETPHNLREAREARERGMAPARVEVDPPFRPGLADLSSASHVILLYWMNEARRDVIRQKPKHADRPLGLFSIRSPVRPNPIGLGVAKLLSVDESAGILEIDAIDCVDGTPLIDIKPYIAAVDAFPEATRRGR